jgi:hypothetical protein
MQTGNGEWTYQIVQGWGHLPAGKEFGGTHGGIATDKAGHVYISTQSETGILVYNPDGTLLKTIAGEYPEVHSMFYAQESGEEFLYTTVQKGTPKENWLFVKMKTDGTVVQKITAPPEAGFKAPNEWRITAAVPAPDGSIFIANGYGDSRIFRFDKQRQLQDELWRQRHIRMAYSIAATAWPWTRATTSLCCWSAIAKTGASATSTSMENSSHRHPASAPALPGELPRRLRFGL